MNKKLGEGFATLTTPYEADLNTEAPFSEYPRPRMRRESYVCLNGEWDFSVESRGEQTYKGRITVPFPPESRISGVCRAIERGDTMRYCRTFTLSEGEGRVLLHFGACDQHARVLVNGAEVGENEGGYLPFYFDITDFVAAGENSLCVEASDPTDTELPYGKQREKRGGMWYTRVSGIWQTVWLECVPEEYIRDVSVATDLSGATVTVKGGAAEKKVVFCGREYPFTGETLRLEVPSPILWTPENPHLYSFEVVSGEDRVSSYFGLRTVAVGEENGVPRILLNGKPFFFNGVLDQGYFADGIFLPASPRGFKEDILRMKAVGFNTLRKHIKLEPQLFYYYCDLYGMLVFQDMINSGRYSFLVDTALPTLFLKKGISHRATKRRREAFFKCAEGIVEALRGHPSVVYYTVFNEGWGQFDADGAYRRLKALDPTRVWDATSGWFTEKESDVTSIHVYFKAVKLKKSARPTVLSEFGGYSCKLPEHSFNLKKTYGYKKFTDLEEWRAAVKALYEKEVFPAIEKGLCGAILTQLSDVEDETNGILTYDRRVQKLPDGFFDKQ